MKATGIVRRIDGCVIIGQKSRKPHKHWVFTDFCPNEFLKKHAKIGFVFKKSEVHSYIIKSRISFDVHPVFYFPEMKILWFWEINFVTKVI